MGIKIPFAVFLALVLAIVLTEATSPVVDTSTNQELTLTPTDAVGYLRTKRQFYPYGGGGFGGSSSFASAQSSAGGGGLFPGAGFSSAGASAGANSFGGGFGKK